MLHQKGPFIIWPRWPVCAGWVHIVARLIEGRGKHCPTPGTCSCICIPVHDDLPLCALLGHIQRVNTIYPAEVRPATCKWETAHTTQSLPLKDSKQVNRFKENAEMMLTTQGERLIGPPDNVDHLTPEQQQKVKPLLNEESVAFACDDNDVGCIPSLWLKILLHDTTPMKHTCMSVLKPLHEEIK